MDYVQSSLTIVDINDIGYHFHVRSCDLFFDTDRS